jgi:hypothetical protein
MTLYHTLYRKMTILIPTLPQMSEYAKSQVPGTTPISGTGMRSIPNGLIPTATRCNPVQLPEPTLPFGLHLSETPNCLEYCSLGSTNGRKFPDPSLRTRMLDNSLAQ